MFGMNPYLYQAWRTQGINGAAKPTGEGSSFEWDPEDRRRARGAAFTNLGASLLAGAGSGNFTEAIAGGLQGFSQTMQGERERAMALRRQEVLDALQRRQVESELSSEDLSRQSVRTSMDNTEEDRVALEAAKVRRRESAAVWAREIEAMAGPDSPEAKRARSYLELGEDVDVERLEKLHEEATQYAPIGAQRRADRFDEDTELGVARVRATADAGYGPIVESRRAEEGLDLDRARLDLSRQSEARMAAQAERAIQMGGQGGIKPGNFADDVASEKNRLKADKILILKGAWNDGRPRFVDGKIIPPAPITAESLAQIDAEAEAEARRIVQSRYGGSGGATLPNGRYVYNPQTGQLEPAP